MEAKRLIKSWLLLALGVALAAETASGINYETSNALIVAVLLLSLTNIVLKPLLMLFSLPFIILTFGIGIWLINALLFLLVAELVPGFSVASFGNALWGAFVVSLTSAIANLIFGKSRVKVQINQPRRSNPGSIRRTRKSIEDDDVIDI